MQDSRQADGVHEAPSRIAGVLSWLAVLTAPCCRKDAMGPNLLRAARPAAAPDCKVRDYFLATGRSHQPLPAGTRFTNAKATPASSPPYGGTYDSGCGCTAMQFGENSKASETVAGTEITGESGQRVWVSDEGVAFDHSTFGGSP